MTSLFRLAGPSAAHRLVESLVRHGVTHVFCVPGESYLPVLDALADAPQIRVVTCRHEAGAANMAEAFGKLTGRPGVCMVTRGPGATHASIGVHTAHQDSTPMILFVGQVARGDKGRGAFQEVDYAQVFGGLAKWAAEIDDASRVGEFVGRAFATATSGRRGPVVLALPEDMLREEAASDDALLGESFGGGLDPAALAAIGERLKRAEKPLLVLGGSGWTAEALAALASWAERLALPVALSFRRKDLIDNRHPCYAGDLGLGVNPKLVARVREADLVIALGARLGDPRLGLAQLHFQRRVGLARRRRGLVIQRRGQLDAAGDPAVAENRGVRTQFVADQFHGLAHIGGEEAFDLHCPNPSVQ